ncbi:restriction endonuclease subunit S [Chromohalobacter israelensis]|uniref:restriction endonuclease subunit S n=1 Tax=Chromohalobacter israelensis TaxID=141390 RepID=UPI003D797A87
MSNLTTRNLAKHSFASKESSTLPSGWTSITIGDAANYLNGRAFKSSEWESTGRPIIRIQNLNNENAFFNRTTQNFEERFSIDHGDVLFAWSASLGVHIWRDGPAWLNQHIFKVIPEKFTYKYFLFYFLKKTTSELYAKAHGSGMVHVTKNKFEATKLPLPPLPEQHRIVAKIEELFSEIDSGVESLKVAQTKLNTARQSLLKAAFEGKLTEQWRKENTDKLECPEALLERIQAEHEAHYQQQLTDWQHQLKDWEAAGKEGKKPRKPKVPKALPPLTQQELAELPELPEGWFYIQLSALGELARGKSKHRPRNDPSLFGGQYPFIQTGEVKGSKGIITEHSATYNETGLAQSRLWPKGTLCITIAANIAETAFLGFVRKVSS